MKFVNQVQRLSLYAFCFLINFEDWTLFNISGELSIAKLAGLIYLVSILPELRRFFRTDRMKLTLLPIWLLFGLLTTMSIININSISDSFFNWSIFQCVVLFWLLANHGRKDNMILEKGMFSFAIGSVVVALLFTAGIGVEYFKGRVSIFGDNQNMIGIKTCVSLIILLLAVVQNRQGWERIRFLFLFPMPILLKLLAGTGSRVAVISFGLAFVMGFLLLKTKSVLGKIATSFVAIPASVYVWYTLAQSETLVRRLWDSAEKSDLAGRDVIWEKLLPLVATNPIVGVGETGYEYYIQAILLRQDSPHNVFLEVLCYTGAIGLILYVIYLLRIIKAGYQSYKANGALLPLLLMVPVMGLLVSGQILTKKLGWVIFAYVVSMSLSETKSVNGSSLLRKHGDSLRKRQFGGRRRSAPVSQAGVGAK